MRCLAELIRYDTKTGDAKVRFIVEDRPLSEETKIKILAKQLKLQAQAISLEDLPPIDPSSDDSAAHDEEHADHDHTLDVEAESGDADHEQGLAEEEEAGDSHMMMTEEEDHQLEEEEVSTQHGGGDDEGDEHHHDGGDASTEDIVELIHTEEETEH